MDINFIQETIDSLRTLTQQNGALTRQNSQLINEVAKESTINTKAEEIKQTVENIDLSPLENKMEEGVSNLSNKIDNIKLPEIDTTELAKESTLNQVSSKLDNINVDVDLSSVAKQGSNADATNSKILEEVHNKLTPLEAVLTELNNGKQEMVNALAMKNVQSSTTKTLSAIASDIRSIAQSPVTVDGGEMYEKQLFGAPTDKTSAYAQPDSPTWNLYQVMANLLSDGRFVNYEGIVLEEYDKLKDTINLNTAGAGGCYLTSDGKLYTEDVTHTWDDLFDGKVNRWVAVCFASASHDYTINNTTSSPIAIHIGRHVGKLQVTVAHKLRELVVTEGNKLDYFGGNFTGEWNKSLVIKNVHSASIFNPSTRTLYMELEDLTNCIYNSTDPASVVELKQTTDAVIDKSIYYGNGNRNNLRLLHISGAKQMKFAFGGLANFGNTSSSNFDKTIIFDDMEDFIDGNYPSQIAGGTAIKKIYFNHIESTQGQISIGLGTYVYIGYKTNDRTRSIYPRDLPSSTLVDIELKDGYRKSINISAMSKVLTAENIALHILDKLADNTDAETLTCVLGTENLATINADETYSSYVALAQAKNWTIS